MLDAEHFARNPAGTVCGSASREKRGRKISTEFFDLRLLDYFGRGRFAFWRDASKGSGSTTGSTGYVDFGTILEEGIDRTVD